MVEMRDFFPQDKIFQQRRAAGAGAQRVLIVGDTHALVGCQRLVLTAFAEGLQRAELIVRHLRCLQAAWRGRLLAWRGRRRRRAVGAIGRRQRSHARL